MPGGGKDRAKVYIGFTWGLYAGGSAMMARSDGGADDDGEIGTWILRNALKQRDVRLFEMVMDDVSVREE